MTAILVVCMGNICRSPLAEAALRSEAQARGVDIVVDSAGTGPWHVGDPPDQRAQAQALRHGIDISGQRGRQVGRVDFDRFDMILALDADNLAHLRRMQPKSARAELSLLLDHVPGWQGQGVPDPYYGGTEGFAAVWQDVTEAAAALLDNLARKP